MRRLLFKTLLISFFLSSCFGSSKVQEDIQIRLNSWDSLMLRYPERVYDSLEIVKFPKLSKENRALHSLLYTIASTRLTLRIQNDSLIKESLDWYKKKSDYRNLCRAYLYYSTSIIKDLNFTTDSIRNFYIITAEEILKSKGVNDKITEAFIYKFKAFHNVFNRGGKAIIKDINSFVKAEELLEKSNKIFRELNITREIHISKLSFLDFFSTLYDYDKKIEILNSIMNSDSISYDIRKRLYRSYSSSYSSKGEYSKSIYYQKRLLSLLSAEDTNEFENCISTLSKEYLKLNEPDSALKYANLYNEITIKDIHKASYGYKLLTDVYAARNDYLNALNYHKKYNQAIIRSIQIRNLDNTNRIKEENDNYYKKTRALSATLKTTSAIFSLLLLIFIIISIYQWFKLRNSCRSGNKEFEELILKLEEKENELKKLWIGNELLKSTSAVHTELIKSIIKEAARCRRDSREISENLNRIVENQKQMSKDTIPEITKIELFASIFPDIASKTDLTPYEKIIQALYASGFDTKEIAYLFSTTSSNIRAVKSRRKS